MFKTDHNTTLNIVQTVVGSGIVDADIITGAALGVLDEVGLDKLSMRLIAARRGFQKPIVDTAAICGTVFPVDRNWRQFARLERRGPSRGRSDRWASLRRFHRIDAQLTRKLRIGQFLAPILLKF